MSDCSPLRLAENGQSSSPSQSLGSQNSHDGADAPNCQSSNRGDDDRPYQHVRPYRRSSRRSEANQSNTRARSQSESSSKSQLRYGARNVIELFVPVSICMSIVVGTMKATDSYHYSTNQVIWYAQMMYTDQSVDTGTRVWQSFANALIMLVCIVVMTTVLILLYKFRCYKTIHGWLILSSLMLLFMFAIMYVAEILKVYNIPMDNYTLAIFIWNFGVVGMICIHWKGPLLLQQGYLITISALMALALIRCLPDWTTWTVLAIVSVWDLVAVLCPRGPLRILVETAQERNEPIFPALIYSSTMVWEIGSGILSTAIVSTIPSISMADDKSSRTNNSKKLSNRNKRNSRHNIETNPQQFNPSSSSGRRVHRNIPNSDMGSQVKRDQHPVEIHYEDGVQTPQVAIIQPSLSGTSDTGDNFHRPQVRALNTTSSIRDRRSVSQEVNVETGREASATELTINFHPQDGGAEHQGEEERGVKLGLGDFIFFSVLVGKASSYGDWTITMTCYVAILVGLCLTLSLLAVFRKALPALPISIAFGLCSYFLSYVFMGPFAETLASNQVFI